MIRNKKGSDKILSIYWFAILFVVAGGIFAMVYIFYSYPYDVREVEANLLANSISDCVSDSGVISELVISEESFNEDFKENFMDVCNLNFDSDDVDVQYYLKMTFSNESGDVFSFSEGNENYLVDCEVNSEEEYENLVKCVSRNFYSSDELGNLYKINVFAIVRKTEQNVR